MSPRSSAYTLAEIMVVVSIVLILAAIAFSSTGRVLRNLRFNNAFNKIVLMVQQARNLAVTGKDSTAVHYGLDFVQSSKIGATTYEVILYSEKNSGSPNYSYDAKETSSDELIERFQLPSDISIIRNSIPPAPPCNATTPPPALFFMRGNGTLEIRCDGKSLNTVTIGLSEAIPGQSARTKTFTIHKAAGVPQVE